LRILITGSDGFIGSNLRCRLEEFSKYQVVVLNRDDSFEDLPDLLTDTDCIFHLAGANRPKSVKEFEEVNVEFTKLLCDYSRLEADKNKKPIQLVFTSSTQVGAETEYGRSKLKAEKLVHSLSEHPLVYPHVLRLSNVFGKWGRPDYNSVVATFCHNISRSLPIQIHDRAATMDLIYIDDLVDTFTQIIEGEIYSKDVEYVPNLPIQYSTTVGALAETIKSFRHDRKSLSVERVGSGLVRALYATYLSYMPVDQSSYEIPMSVDSRGNFVEFLKTPDCGQFSFFTARPGAVRGGHYHHTKNEKFVIVQGDALFRFQHVLTGETFELTVSAKTPQIVETIPGWAHNIENVGREDLVALLWANEIFDSERPDTYRRSF